MKYNFICEKCNKVKVVNKSMGSDFSKVVCDCGGLMKQDFSVKKFQLNVPCTFDSYGEYAPKDLGESSLEEYMK